MSVTSTVTAIDQGILTYVPAVIAGVQAAEVSGAAGDLKAKAVMDGIQVGSQALAQVNQPNVAAIAGLINLVVSIFNALGVFNHKAV